MQIANHSIKWSNYFKPTPTNIQYLVEGMKGIVATASVSSFIAGSPEVAFWILISGEVLDFVSKFLSRVANDEAAGKTTDENS